MPQEFSSTRSSPAVRRQCSRLVSLIIAGLYILVSSPAHAEPPQRCPLIPVDAGQDGEDVAMGIDDYYAGFDAIALRFTPGAAGSDANGTPLAEAVTLTLDGPLAAEMGFDVGATFDGAPREVTFDAPGRGWAIARTYALPDMPGLILSAYHDGEGSQDPYDRLVFVRMTGQGAEVLHSVDAHNTLDRDDRPADWPFPTFPAVIETGADVPSSRAMVWNGAQAQMQSPASARPLASLVYHERPMALDPLLPAGGCLDFSEIWWRDDARAEHTQMVRGLFWTMTNAALALEGMEQVGATAMALSLLQPITAGRIVALQPDDLLGRYTATLYAPDADGVVSALPLGTIDGLKRLTQVEVITAAEEPRRLWGRLYRLTHASDGVVAVLGSLTADGSAPGYSGWRGPFDRPPPQSDAAGVIYGLAPGHAVMVLNPEDPLDWRLIELKR